MDSRELAIFLMGSRDTTWDARQGLLFLAKDGESFTFNVGYCPGFDVSIESNHRVWLPAVTGDAAATAFMTGSTSSITLPAFKAKVTEIATAKASTVEGYPECVAARIRMEHIHSDGVVHTFSESFTIGSGLPSQVMTVSGGEDHGYWLNGDNASLFEPDGRTVVNTRPLPAGTHTFVRHYQAPEWEPCDFRPEYNGPDAFTVTATAPDDVTHEALFDPEDRRNGTRVGEVNLSDQVSKLQWFSDGTPRVELETSTRLTNKAVEIIAQDGAVAHAFHSVDSTKSGRTLSWPVADQPWSAGDKLMLRIRPAVNRPPVFTEDSHTFTLAENTPPWTFLGLVSARDPDKDSLIYSFVGNGRPFALSALDGVMVVHADGVVDYEEQSTHTLTIEANDGNGGTARAAVTVNVTDVAEVPPPTQFTTEPDQTDMGTLHFTWPAVDGAAKYRVRYRVVDGEWQALEATGLSATLSGLACGTRYQLRTQSFGDGATWPASWGGYNTSLIYETATCPE